MKQFLLSLIFAIAFGCSENSQNNTTSHKINLLADAYLQEFLNTHPEAAYSFGIEMDRHDGHPMNDVNEIKAWQKFEDSLYVEINKIAPASLKNKVDKITYWTLKEKLESQIEFRVCKQYTWNVSHMTGWQDLWLNIARKQPIATEVQKAQALTRWQYLPVFIDNEITNLNQGLKEGYSMPKVIVNVVIDQMQTILDYPLNDSPFMALADRDTTVSFRENWKNNLQEAILPAIAKYHDYLKNIYLPKAREEVSITNIPNGEDCYQAYIRYWTSTNKTAKEIFELGNQVVAKNKEEILELGQQYYGTTGFTETIAHCNSDSLQYFQRSEDLLTYHTEFLNKAKQESLNWFNQLPSKTLTIKPYEAHEGGSARYERATTDKPAYFRLSLKNPKSIHKGQSEITNIHEAYPGHHLQIGIANDLQNLHPITKVTFIGSYSEGWARYAEQLGEEMGLYSSKSALILRRAWPSRGMIMDPGVHFHGWTKEDLTEFALESGKPAFYGEILYHRIIIMPAQLTSYDVGGEEIKRLRKKAEKALGTSFNIKEFHQRILANGAIPMNSLTELVEDWILEASKKIPTSGDKNP